MLGGTSAQVVVLSTGAKASRSKGGKAGHITLSTRVLESYSGQVLWDRAAVWEEAEDMAASRQKTKAGYKAYEVGLPLEQKPAATELGDTQTVTDGASCMTGTDATPEQTATGSTYGEGFSALGPAYGMGMGGGSYYPYPDSYCGYKGGMLEKGNCFRFQKAREQMVSAGQQHQQEHGSEPALDVQL